MAAWWDDDALDDFEGVGVDDLVCLLAAGLAARRTPRRSAARPRRGHRGPGCGPYRVRSLVVDPAEVAAVAGVDLDLGVVLDEQRHLDLVAGLEGGGLGAGRGAVALQARLGVGDLEDDARRAARCTAGCPRGWRC